MVATRTNKEALVLDIFDYAGSKMPISFSLFYFMHEFQSINFFFSHYFFPLLIYAQPILDLNLARRIHFRDDFLICFWC